MKSFAASLKACEKKHNATRALNAKIQMRANVLDYIGADRCDVFDAYAGPGKMYRGVWCRARSYTGCDLDWFRDDRRVFVADTLEVMRAVDLSRFNVFDVDAFGSPWDVLTILASRRTVTSGETIGVCVTDGVDLQMKLSGVPHAMARLAGVNARMKYANRVHDNIASMALAEVFRRMKVRTVKHWRTHATGGSAMRYDAFVLQLQATTGSER